MVYQSCSNTTRRRDEVKLAEISKAAAGARPGACEVSLVTLAQLEENDSRVGTSKTHVTRSNQH